MTRKKSRTKQATANGCRLPNGIEEEIVAFVYKCALDDAMQRGANRGAGKMKLAGNADIKNLVREFVEDLFAGKNPQVMDYANRISSNVKKASITFGHIQKVLNMAAKYMYFACYGRPDIRTGFQTCDCPMDRKMIREVRKEYKKLKGIPPNKPICEIDDATCPSAKWRNLSWSTIGFPGDTSHEYYVRFQKMVRELAKAKEMIPVEYDFWLWNQP